MIAKLKRVVAVFIAMMLSGLHVPVSQVWAAETATLDGIEVSADQVTVHLSEQVRYNGFVTSEPPRLIVEFLNTEYAASGKAQEGQGEYLKRVRSAQYQREPNLISRIVLDLKKLVSYKAKWDQNRLVVSLIGSLTDIDEEEDAWEEPEPTAADPEPTAAEPETEPMVAEPAPTAAPKPTAVPKLATVPSSVPVTAPMRDAAAPAAAVKPASLPKKMTTTASSELSHMAMSSDIKPEREVRVQPQEQKKKTKLKGSPAVKSRRDILATLPSDPISLDFDDTSIQDIFKLLAIKAKVNIVYGSDVSGSLTLRLSDVPFNEAFMTVLSMQGLVASQVGQNILRVMTPTTLTKERTAAVTQTRVIHLNYVDAKKVVAALTAVRSAEKRTGVINVDEYTNSLIITDSLDGIAAAERLLAELDVRPKQVMIEVKLVEVQLNKDFDVGIEWDYFSVNQSKQFGQHGQDVIGNISKYPSSANEASVNNINPIDQNVIQDLSKLPVGGGGRGTGVFLPATNVFGAFTYGRVTNNYLLNATLSAAASRGKAKVLSDPKISAMNGEKATIDITTSIPFVTSETVQGATPTTTEKVEYIKTGIQLEVQPTINSDGSITLDVKPNVSQPSAVSASAGSTGAIATDSRKAETRVHVNDGDTIVIGGLITDSESDTVAKIPLLGDIPILGWLFKKKSVTRTRTELLIFVTSKIVKN